MPWTAYALVRSDLPWADQIVQVGHACLEAGRLFANPAPDQPTFLVVLTVKNQTALSLAQWQLTEQGIAVVGFEEPDHNYGLTALCTAALPRQQGNQLFKKYQLWQPPLETD